MTKNAPQFLAPEIFPLEINLEETLAEGLDEIALYDEDIGAMGSWDVAIRYHDFKSRASMKDKIKKLRRLSALAILERAKNILGSVVSPQSKKITPWGEEPELATEREVDLEETLENSAAQVSGRVPLLKSDIWMEYLIKKRQPIILAVDTSLSMTGEKLALTAVALAVVLLQFPSELIGIVAFETEANLLKAPLEKVEILGLIERFLDVPAQGYTHLEEGMKLALKSLRTLQKEGKAKQISTVLLTDGKYTAGRDPTYLAGKFPHLVVLKMGNEKASLELCEELARKGGGMLREVDELGSLPQIMYGVVKDLLRGATV